jgi:hypothetical protein
MSWVQTDVNQELAQRSLEIFRCGKVKPNDQA